MAVTPNRERIRNLHVHTLRSNTRLELEMTWVVKLNGIQNSFLERKFAEIHEFWISFLFSGRRLIIKRDAHSGLNGNNTMEHIRGNCQ